MDGDQHSPPPLSAVRPASSAYLMSWVAVAAFGLGYIGIAATRPDLLGVILPLSEQQQDQVVAGNAADVADELASLRKWVNDMQHELAAARSALQDQSQQYQALVQRVAAAEERLGNSREVRAEVPAGRPVVQKLQPRAQAQPQPPAPQVAAAPAQTSPAASESANPATTGVRVLNNATAPIATGSVPDSASAQSGFAAAKVTPAPVSPRGIEIGSSDSLEGLRAKWSDISSRNADVIGDAAPRYRLSADGRQSPFTLLAGPFDPAEAARACNTLRAKGVTCRISSYGGNSF